MKKGFLRDVWQFLSSFTTRDNDRPIAYTRPVRLVSLYEGRECHKRRKRHETDAKWPRLTF